MANPTPPLVYIAGPYSAPSRAGVEINIANAVDWGVQIALLGGMPVIPHANTADARFEATQPYPFWIAGTMGLLRACDACVLIPEWQHSSGARGERAEMLRLMRPVFEAVPDWEKLERWIAGWRVGAAE